MTDNDTTPANTQIASTSEQDASIPSNPSNSKTGILDLAIESTPNYDIVAWQKQGIIPATIDLEDASIQSAINAFQEANLTSEQAQKFITSYLTKINDNIEVAVEDINAESLKVFGSKQQLQNATKTLNELLTKLSAEEATVLKERINYDPQLAKIIANIAKPEIIRNVIPSKAQATRNVNTALTAKEAYAKVEAIRASAKASGRLYEDATQDAISDIWRQVKK